MVGFDESSRFLREESPGIWWVSHPYKGAFRLELNERNHSVIRTKTYDASAGFPVPLQINMCNLDKRMIFATSKGFYQWDEATDRMIPDGSALSNWIDIDRSYQRIFNSPDGNVWIFGDQSIRMLPLGGFSMLDEPNPRFASMAQNPVPTPFEAIEFLENGLVCVPVEQGFTYLTPDLMHQVQSTPRVQISDVNHLNAAKSQLSIENETIQLKAGVHALEFKLSGLNSDWAGLLEYQWRIQNVAEQWSRPTSNSRITLSGLQPGTHAVEFRAFIGENIPCAVTPVTIFVSPYWYQLIWVRILGFVLSVSLIVVLFRRNQRILEAKHLIQKQNEHNQRLKVEQAMKASMERTEMALQAQKTASKEHQLAAKNKELASATMHLVQKAQLIQTIDGTLQSLKTKIPSKNQAEVDSLLNIIKDGGKLDDAWDDFTKQFDLVHVEFHQRITTRYPQLTKTDFKLCTYLRMNLSSKEIASLMFVSLRAVEVSRSRLRKRLNLDKSQNLIAFIQNI
jgi:DNA-binding CsgD family transcriptional regulator